MEGNPDPSDAVVHYARSIFRLHRVTEGLWFRPIGWSFLSTEVSAESAPQSQLTSYGQIRGLSDCWRNIASLTTPAVSSTFFPHHSIHSEMSAISLS